MINLLNIDTIAMKNHLFKHLSPNVRDPGCGVPVLSGRLDGEGDVSLGDAVEGRGGTGDAEVDGEEPAPRPNHLGIGEGHLKSFCPL